MTPPSYRTIVLANVIAWVVLIFAMAQANADKRQAQNDARYYRAVAFERCGADTTEARP